MTASIGAALIENTWHLRFLGLSVTVWDLITLLAIAGLGWLAWGNWKRRAKALARHAAILLGSLLGLSLLVYGTWIEPLRLQVVHEQADLPGWPSEEPLRIALISDLHHGPNSTRWQLRRLVRAVNAAAPDVVLIAGDFVAYPGIPDLEGLGQLSGLQARLGTYAVLGNHDYYGSKAQLQELQAVLAGAGIRTLHNETVRLVPGVGLAGIDSAIAGRADVNAALAHLIPGTFVIGLAHEPESFITLADHDVPLTLAGHTHGGQIRLPGIGALVPVSAVAGAADLLQLPRNKQSGWFTAEGSHLYISRGVGTSGPRARLWCRPELTILTIAAAKGD